MLNNLIQLISRIWQISGLYQSSIHLCHEYFLMTPSGSSASKWSMSEWQSVTLTLGGQQCLCSTSEKGSNVSFLESIVRLMWIRITAHTYCQLISSEFNQRQERHSKAKYVTIYQISATFHYCDLLTWHSSLFIFFFPQRCLDWYLVFINIVFNISNWNPQLAFQFITFNLSNCIQTLCFKYNSIKEIGRNMLKLLVKCQPVVPLCVSDRSWHLWILWRLKWRVMPSLDASGGFLSLQQKPQCSGLHGTLKAFYFYFIFTFSSSVRLSV